MVYIVKSSMICNYFNLNKLIFQGRFIDLTQGVFIMKKFAAFIVAAVFALAIVFTVISTATHKPTSKSGSAYASIVPIPPPSHQKKDDGSSK